MNKYREGKVKQTPKQGVKKILKLNAYKQSKLFFWEEWRRTFCIMGQRVNLWSEPKLLSGGGVKASFKWAQVFIPKKENKFHKFDPKPSDLVMSRLKKW